MQGNRHKTVDGAEKRCLYFCAVAFLLLFFNSLCFCESNQSSNKNEKPVMDMSLEELMNVEVFTTSKVATKIEKAPGTVYSFSGQQLLNEGVLTIQDLLMRIPGVQLVPNRSGHTNIWFRGVQNRYNNNILLIVDGVPIRDFVYGNFLIDEMYPVEQMERIEIMLGPGSVLYGANAQAGIISITTKKHAKQIMGTASTFGTYSGSTHYYVKDLSVFFKYLETTGGFSPDKGRDGRSRIYPQDQNRELAIFDVKYDLTDDLMLHASKTHYEYPYTYSKYDRSQVQTRDPMTFSMNLKHGDIDEDGRLDVIPYYVHYDFREDSYRVQNDGTPRSRKREYYNSDYGGFDAYYSKRIFNDHVFLFGSSLLYHRAINGAVSKETDLTVVPHTTTYGTLIDDPDRSFKDYAFYAQDTWSVTDDLDLTFGARYDKPESYDKEWSFRFAAVKTFDKGYFLKFLAATSFRVPTYREARKTEPDGTALFDPTLSAEHMKTYEVAFGQKTKNNNSWMVTGFYNKFTDYIADEYDAGLGDEIFHNYEERVTRGVEVSGNRWLIKEKLDLRGSVTYLQGFDKANREEFHGLSNWLGNVNVHWIYDKKLSFDFIANYVSKPHVSDDYQSASTTQNEGLNRGYITLGANINYKISENTTFQVIGRNLTNNNYYSPHFGPSTDYDYEWPGAEVLFVLRHEW
jgi:outer membrane receptor for ferrienterochelin and colicins